MNRQDLIQLLQVNHSQFTQQLRIMSDDDLCYSPAGKWSALQQLDHIVRSVTPVSMALAMPVFIIQWKFGRANRPSKTFNELVEKYNRKLSEGGAASGRYVPLAVGAAQKEVLLQKLSATVTNLCRRTGRHSEEALDKNILPHPLLGKLTYREMLYFTAYHVAHHSRLIEAGLQKTGSA